MDRLLIGCPVAKRDWILPSWIQHVETSLAACQRDLDVEFAFLADPLDPTVDVIIANTDRMIHWVWHEEGEHGRTWSLEGGRTWNLDRYRYMVEIRNLLLGKVRLVQPDFYFSLDSDILIAPPVVEGLFEGMGQFDVVGAKCFMTSTGRQFPSYAMLRGAALFRKDFDYGPSPVDVVMGAKLMNPKAYAVDYEVDVQGEDTGICRAWQKAGVKIGYDARYVSKHCMSEQWLTRVDPRCGY